MQSPAFISALSVVRAPLSSTPLLRRNGWFEELPTPNEAVNWPFYFVRYIYSGDYSGNYAPGFSFVMHNLQLKYGKD